MFTLPSHHHNTGGQGSHRYQRYSAGRTHIQVSLLYWAAGLLGSGVQHRSGGLEHSNSEIRPGELLTPAHLCHKDTAQGTQSPLL